MSTPLRVLAFGIVSGLIWSLVPGTLSELFRSPGETATVIVSGMLSGIVTSFALAAALMRCHRLATILFGALSLPLGAFAFGFLLSVVQWLVREFSSTSYRFVGHGFAPFIAGAQYAVFSITVFGYVLLP